MSKDKVQEQEQDQGTGTGTAIAKVDTTALANSAGGFDGFNNAMLAELQSDIESTLKQISVTDFKGAKAFVGQNLSLLDAFPFEMTETSRQTNEPITVAKVMFTVADAEFNVHYVMQNANASRERFITLYSQIRAANAAAGTRKQLTLTNVEFQEVGTAKYGNKPIVLTFTKDTQQVWS